MLVYAGIDEAGYGPMLGPLCVGCCVFAVESWHEGESAPDLWQLLGSHVARRRKGAGTRIPVADSKKLKLPNTSKAKHPLTYLERGVFCFLPEAPADDVALFEQVGANLTGPAWYGGAHVSLPVGNDPAMLRISINQIHQAMKHAGLSVRSYTCQTLDARRFNEHLARTGSKAATSFGLFTRAIEGIWRHFPDEHPRIVVDRQGGRIQYAGSLARAFPSAAIATEFETPELSRYHLEREGSRITITFATASEDRHMPVALASMLAKYVRELAMARFNRYFQAMMPDLKPTAGYVQDARRWLRDASAVVRDLDRSQLVRRR
ncbi:MAG: hypothetical protein KAS72_00915 [Phycisphaerales bacterium]|nr:hypothetical protein [Phycisphaerales bacterium]